jgi:hypothetical protein
MGMGTDQPETPKSKPRWYQFSLRTLLLGVTLVSVLCSIATYIGWDFIWGSIWNPLCYIAACIDWAMPLVILVLLAVAGVIAYTRSVEVVRLLAAVVIGLASCFFVAAYDGMAEIRFRHDHPGQELRARSVSGEFVTAHRQHAYAIPVVGFLLGCLIIRRRPKSKVWIELVVQTLWILAFMWACFVLIIWQVQNIPIFSGGRWHY